MPKPVLVQHNGAIDFTPEDLYELATGHRFFRRNGAPPIDLGAAWQAVGQQLTAVHAATFPGSRPHAWWRFSAPERRRQIDFGAVHTMLQNGTRVVQKFFYGRPATHAAADENCVFECQCAYLRRHGLFTPEEQRHAASPSWRCAACQFVGFGEPSLSRAQVQAWWEGAYRA